MRLSARLFVFLLVVLLGLGNDARAQDSDKEIAIRELMEITQAFALMDQVLVATSSNLFGSIKKLRPDIPKKIMDLAEVEFAKVFAESKPVFEKMMIEIYGKHFSLEELRQIISFNQTEVGRKVIRVMPEIVRESSLIGQQWGQRAGKEAARRAIAKLKEKGYDL